MLNCFVILIVVLLGVYYMLNPNGLHDTKRAASNIETFDDSKPKTKLPATRCPNILIQKGNAFYLYNSRVTKVPGVNPIRFDSLEDYSIFVQWQKSQGIICPVLFVQQTYDAQGAPVFKTRTSPFNLQGGLQDHIIGGNYSAMQSKLFDAGRDDPPYNQHSYPAYDPLDQYIGLDTPLDKMFHDYETPLSPNPMDANWGGPKFTEMLVKGGYYRGDE